MVLLPSLENGFSDALLIHIAVGTPFTFLITGFKSYVLLLLSLTKSVNAPEFASNFAAYTSIDFNALTNDEDSLISELL